MTEPTTTETFALAVRYREGSNEDNSLAFYALMSLYSLHDALTSGSPLPEQWPQAQEIEELREKVAKYESALREIACYRIDALNKCQGIDHEDVKIIEVIARTVLEP